MVKKMNRAAFGLILLFILIGGLWTGRPPSPEPPSEIKPNGTIVAMGDSLTEGLGVPEEMAYPALLQKALRAKG